MQNHDIGGMRHVIRAAVWLGLLGLFVSITGTCRSTRTSLNEATLKTVREVYDESKSYADPLCVAAGPFPFRSGSAQRCDKCQALEQAGLLARRIVDDGSGGYVEYALTELGKPLYRVAADPEQLAAMRTQFERRTPAPTTPFNPKLFDRPRVCLGTTRFYAVAEALAPFVMGSEHYLSVKVVAEAKAASDLLFDPRIRSIGLKLPQRPEPGQPILFPPEIITLQFYPGDPRPEISSTRYGAWVNEP